MKVFLPEAARLSLKDFVNRRPQIAQNNQVKMLVNNLRVSISLQTGEISEPKIISDQEVDGKIQIFPINWEVLNGEVPRNHFLHNFFIELKQGNLTKTTDILIQALSEQIQILASKIN